MTKCISDVKIIVIKCLACVNLYINIYYIVYLLVNFRVYSEFYNFLSDYFILYTTYIIILYFSQNIKYASIRK